MRALFVRELNSFFNNLIAYVVISVFLIITGLFLWIFPTAYNIPESGYANLDGLFSLAPFVFLFLVPAITMRFFADELRMGTLELLLTKPVTMIQVVVAKYLAGVVLVAISLLPTLIYFITVHIYAAPPGVDTGAIWGSYAGLLLLGMVFVAAGLLSSTLSGNQVVAFIIALFISGFLYIGFELLYSLKVFGGAELFIRNLGLQVHYTSMGRGVIDSRNVLYFLGVIVLFLTLTILSANRLQMRKQALLWVLSAMLIVSAVNLSASRWFIRLDLTTDKRYSLTDATKKMLRELDDIVYFRVYLDGELPPEFRKLRNDTREMLDEFNAWTDNIHYEFISPLRAVGGDARELADYYRMLSDKGLEPAQVQMHTGDGASQRVVFPAALVSYKGKEIPLKLIQDKLGVSMREALHESSMALEYTLASAILQLSKEKKERIAFLEGHGELDYRNVASITKELEAYYDVDRVQIGEDIQHLKAYRTLISARPRKAFSEQEKFILDQYLMHGGSMLWLVDPVFADMDSLLHADETLGLALDINMNDFFFRYGVRLNPFLLKDLNAAPIPVTTGFVAGRPQINLLPWYFFPVLNPIHNHVIVNNLNVVRAEFVSSIDTVDAPGVEKTILLTSSDYTRTMPVPVRISLDLLEKPVNESLFTGPPEAIAVLLEGTFESLYRNRIAPDVEMPDGFERRDSSVRAAMIVVAGGSLIRNQFGSDGRPLPLGFDRYTGQQFGNEDFILNAVNYLTDDSGIISARAKDIRLRLLNRQMISANMTAVQLVNTMLPVLLVIGFGGARLLWRKRRYAK